MLMKREKYLELRDRVRDAWARYGRFVTLGNIVVFLGVFVTTVFVFAVLPLRVTMLVVAMAAFAIMGLAEIVSLRKAQQETAWQMRRMQNENERLAREVARSRNDMDDLRRSLAQAGDRARIHGGDGITAENKMAKSLAEQLSRLGQAPVRAENTDECLLPPDVHVDDLSDDQLAALVQTAVRQDRVDVFLQPVVSLPQRKVRFHEMFSRIRVAPDIYVPAGRYVGLAAERDFLPAIDNVLLLRALTYIRDSAEEGGRRSFFCNITGLTLNDPKFMGDLVEFVAAHRLLAPRLVFEMGQDELEHMSPAVLQVLQGLARIGCRFSMDSVRHLSFDFARLDARHIRYLKIEAGLLLSEMTRIGGLGRLKQLKAALDHEGIDLIVEKIETERQLRELLDIGIDYGQGYLFGQPTAGD